MPVEDASVFALLYRAAGSPPKTELVAWITELVATDDGPLRLGTESFL